MRTLATKINAACAAIGDSDVVEYDGEDSFRRESTPSPQESERTK
jgi:hypothetical protein